MASLAAMKSAPVARAGGGCSPTVSKQFFGKTIEPYTGKNTAVFRYTLTNCRGTQVKILTYGGTVQSIVTPSRRGREANVVLGFKTLRDYVKFASPPVIANGGPYFGETIGRYGNRIAKGTFKLNGKTYTLPLNNGANSLHGGLVGFGNHIWASQKVTAPGSAGVRLTLVSPNGDASGAAGSPGCVAACTGYPAQLTVVVTYTLNNRGQLGIHYKATNNDKKLSTVLNLTNHSYFNMAGEASAAGSAYRQFVQINANRYTPVDSTLIPLGTEPSVKGTPFDFTRPHTIGSRIDDVSAPD
ncbi:MAG TPA: aldose epimerase family protein, partial [Streptosporangiaceae bacterium]|nr:aldose epimerase family protein [Streptosporangiaceae bacterium]